MIATLLNSVTFQVTTFALAAILFFGLATFYPTTPMPIESHTVHTPHLVGRYLSPT